MNRAIPPKLLIMDACVLIDYLQADRTLFKSVSEHVGTLCVVSPVLEEVRGEESRDELERLGISVIEPEMEDAYTAAGESGPLSFQDHLCLLTAKRLGLACVTNDKSLRKACTMKGVPLIWGLELRAILHKTGGISENNAMTVARAVQKLNPLHITGTIVSQLGDIIRQQEEERKPYLKKIRLFAGCFPARC